MPWDTGDAVRKDAAMLASLGDLSPAMSKVAGVARDAIDSNFHTESDGTNAWHGLAPSTVADRVRKGYGGEHPILQRTGELMSTIDITAGSDAVTIAPQAEYAVYHQEGTSKMPARPFIAFTDAEEEMILKAIAEHIEGGG